MSLSVCVLIEESWDVLGYQLCAESSATKICVFYGGCGPVLFSYSFSE